MGKILKVRVFLTEYGVVKVLEAGKIDIALVDLYSSAGGSFCIVYLTRQTAEAIALTLDRVLLGGEIEISSATVRLILRGKSSKEVIELLKTELEIEVITS